MNCPHTLSTVVGSNLNPILCSLLRKTGGLTTHRMASGVCFSFGKKGWGFGGEWGSASHVFVVGSENINAENRWNLTHIKLHIDSAEIYMTSLWILKCCWIVSSIVSGYLLPLILFVWPHTAISAWLPISFYIMMLTSCPWDVLSCFLALDFLLLLKVPYSAGLIFIFNSLLEYRILY